MMGTQLKPQYQTLLGAPKGKINLEELANELNAIAQIRHGARLAFCKRLAAAYILVVGRRPIKGKPGSKAFMHWCNKNLRSATGKQYSSGTIAGYLVVGFNRNPEKYIEDETKRRLERREATKSLMRGLEKSVSSTARVQLLESYRRRKEITKVTSGDVASEVNKLMSVWEAATPAARAQFIYMVAGVRIAV